MTIPRNFVPHCTILGATMLLMLTYTNYSLTYWRTPSGMAMMKERLQRAALLEYTMKLPSRFVMIRTSTFGGTNIM